VHSLTGRRGRSWLYTVLLRQRDVRENRRAHTKVMVSRKSPCALTLFVKLSFLPNVTVAGFPESVCPLSDLVVAEASCLSPILTMV
jgi:hypothetical protein